MRKLILFLCLLIIVPGGLWAFDSSTDLLAERSGYGTIQRKKAASTEATFYPDADPETSSVDGYVNRYASSGQYFSVIRDGSGTGADDSSNYASVRIEAHTTTDLFKRLMRGIVVFDTSSISDGATITSATLSLYGYSKSGTAFTGAELNITATTTASDTALAAADYEGFSDTEFCDTGIAYADLSVGSYNDFVLNSSGIANISKTGATKFAVRWSNDIDNSCNWVSEQNMQFLFDSRDNGSNAAKLVVRYTQ